MSPARVAGEVIPPTSRRSPGALPAQETVTRPRPGTQLPEAPASAPRGRAAHTLHAEDAAPCRRNVEHGRVGAIEREREHGDIGRQTVGEGAPGRAAVVAHAQQRFAGRRYEEDAGGSR